LTTYTFHAILQFVSHQLPGRDIQALSQAIRGCIPGGSGERLHGMQEVSGSIPLFSTKKALYFAGSTVLFFLLKLVFWGCVASPAPFSGFCRRFLYTPQLLTLHRFQKRMFVARLFSRLLHHPPQCTA